ncbi:uncharacterized protein DS421_12g359430 [Arachis hypogaea]|nr:uncharacterized protein DS421_12g359430 [Arachis hypogaea]
MAVMVCADSMGSHSSSDEGVSLPRRHQEKLDTGRGGSLFLWERGMVSNAMIMLLQ